MNGTFLVLTDGLISGEKNTQYGNTNSSREDPIRKMFNNKGLIKKTQIAKLDEAFWHQICSSHSAVYCLYMTPFQL
jgi:hypothetical protein